MSFHPWVEEERTLERERERERREGEREMGVLQEEEEIWRR
jgi:hypothetical protein